MLFISSLLNFLFLLLGILVIAKKGGFSYLSQKIFAISAKSNADNKFYPPYYLHKISHFEILPKSNSDVIFLGDSITDECEWAELLGNLNIKNRGISGDTTERILNRLDEIVESKPKQIFLMVGINDFINSGKSVQQTFEDYKNILLALRDKTPNTEVFIQSTLPVNKKILNFSEINQKVVKLNIFLQEIAKELSFKYIDLFSHLSDSQNQLDARYTLDGVHLNGQAYLVWKEVKKRQGEGGSEQGGTTP